MTKTKKTYKVILDGDVVETTTNRRQAIIATAQLKDCYEPTYTVKLTEDGKVVDLFYSEQSS